MASVLIADDDSNLRGTLKELLGTAGFQVTAVSNGEAAVKANDELAAQGKHFDIVILDLLLPKVAGLDVASRFQTTGVQSKIIFISGVFKSAAHVQDAKDKYKPLGFLVKPFNNEDLLKLCLDADDSGPQGVEVHKAPMPAEGGLLESPALHLMWRAARENHTGILDIFGGERRGRIFVYRGRCTMAQANSPTINVAVELIRAGILTAEMFQQAVQLATERRQGLYKIIKAEGWCEDADFKAAYKALIPKAVGYIVAASGSFRWTDTNKFSKLIPAAPVDLWSSVIVGLRGAEAEQLAPHVEPRAVLRLAPGDNWDEIGEICDAACGSSSLLRAINGRATIAQMLSAARNDRDRAERLRQAYLLMSTQAVIASTEVIKIEHKAPLPQQVAAPAVDDEQPAAAMPARGASAADAGAAAAASLGGDDGIDFTAEEEEARRKVTSALKSMKDKTHYEILGVASGADENAIKKGYYGLARDFHPDSYAGLRLGSAQGALEAVYQLVQEAHATLTDADKRANYDAAQQMEEEGMTTDIGALFEAGRHFTKAKHLVDRGEMVGAIKLLRLAHEVNPGNLEWKAYYYYADWWQNRNANRANEAVDVITEAAKDLAAMAELPYFAGHILLEVGDLKRASRLLKKAVQLDPKHVMATRALRTLHKKEEDAAKGSGGLGRFLKR
jgi:CheY-like chemotaxis protein